MTPPEQRLSMAHSREIVEPDLLSAQAGREWTQTPDMRPGILSSNDEERYRPASLVAAAKVRVE
jgi:hypothetical protein